MPDARTYFLDEMMDFEARIGRFDFVADSRIALLVRDIVFPSRQRDGDAMH